MKPTNDHAYPVSEEHYEDGLTNKTTGGRK